jgi:hypothetical protein
MVLLAGLDLVICSESIETVSISGSYRLEEGGNNSRTIVKSYENRHSSQHHLSLEEYFHKKKNAGRIGVTSKIIIPHYVGGRSQPVYPVTEGFAKATFLIHKPWYKGSIPFSDDDDVIAMFEQFVNSEECPVSVKIPFERMRYRYEQKKNGEAVAKDMDVNDTRGCDDDLIEFMELAATFYHDGTGDGDLPARYNFEKGEDYEWDKDPIKVRKVVMYTKNEYVYILGYIGKIGNHFVQNMKMLTFCFLFVSPRETVLQMGAVGFWMRLKSCRNKLTTS